MIENDKPVRDANAPKQNKGFRVMDAERQREIASRGGKTAHANGNAHTFTSEEAREAGKKGGASVSADREHMAEIGVRGGRNSWAKRKAKAEEDESEN